MKRVQRNGLSFLQSQLLLDAGVPHGWFDRSLGNVIFRPENPFDDPEWIDLPTMKQRWAQACEALNLDSTNLVTTSGLRQTDIIQKLVLSHAGTQAGPADAYVTGTSGMPILLAAADCTQTIMYAPDKKTLAVVHAGGLGTAKAVAAKAAKRLIDEYGADPTQIIVAIGPSVSPDHFVPSRDADNFALSDIASSDPVLKTLADGRIGYDIAATNVRQLIALDIPLQQIDVSDIDTFTDQHWFSYERDKTDNLAAAMRRHGLFVALP